MVDYCSRGLPRPTVLPSPLLVLLPSCASTFTFIHIRIRSLLRPATKPLLRARECHCIILPLGAHPGNYQHKQTSGLPVRQTTHKTKARSDIVCHFPRNHPSPLRLRAPVNPSATAARPCYRPLRTGLTTSTRAASERSDPVAHKGSNYSPDSAAMAVQSNGRAKKPKKPAQSAQLNGRLNGSLNGNLNGHVEKPQKSGALTRLPKGRPKRTTVGNLTDVIGRYGTSSHARARCA